MKKTILIVVLAFALLVTINIVWLKLPVTINRYSDIQFGNRIIEQIENYRTTHGLPASNDWSTLKKFGFEDKGDFLFPFYDKLDDQNYQLTFVEGFDGPYLTWNSYDREWKNDFPRFPVDTLTEK